MAPRLSSRTGMPVTVLRTASEPFPQHGVLGAIRSLGRWGVPVILASPDPRSGIAGRSRYVHAFERFTPGPGGVGALTALAARHGRSVLLPTDDEAAMFVQTHADALREGFVFPELPVGLVERSIDKETLAAMAEDAGVATLRIRRVRTPEELDAFCDLVGLPLVVKAPAGPRARGRRSVVIAATREEAVRMLGEDGVLLQEHLPGSPRRVNWIFDAYFDASSTCRFWATGRKIAQHPAYAGTATHAVTERNDDIARLVTGFLGDLGYVGPVDVDVRFDERTGRYVLLDVNPRIGGTFRAFVAVGGLDVARCAYLDLTGGAIPDEVVPDGRGWILESHVASSMLPYRTAGWLTARSWLASFRGVEEGALLAMDDLRPALRAAGHVAARGVASLRGRSGTGRGSEGVT